MKIWDAFCWHIRFGLRLLRKDLGSTVFASLELMLGIGLVSIIFSYINGVMIRGLPFEDSRRIVYVQRGNIKTSQYAPTLPVRDYFDLAKQQSSFEEVAAFARQDFKVRSGADGMITSTGSFMTANTFRLRRVRPLMGRLFLENEDAPGAEPVVILGYDLWQTHFAGDPAIVGKAVFIDRKPATVVGIMPSGFKFPVRDEIWMPLRAGQNDDTPVEVFARLKGDVSMPKAAAECSLIAKRLEQSRPVQNAGFSYMTVQPFIQKYMGGVDNLLWMMFGSAICVLILACANVANLQLARALRRMKEMAIRASLGASRARLIGQLLSESVLLAFVSAIGGMVIAWVGVHILQFYSEQARPPFWMSFELDGRAVLFVGALTLFVGIAAGLFPALQASKADVNEALKDDSRGASSLSIGWFGRVLVVIQLGLSMALVCGAALLSKSVAGWLAMTLPFPSGSVQSVWIETDYQNNPDPNVFYDRLRERLQRIPGADGVAFSTRYRLYAPGRVRLSMPGVGYLNDEARPFAHEEIVSEGYFKALGVSLIEGREFGQQDRSDALAVAVVNASLAKRLWPKESAVGQRFYLAPNGGQPIQVVGVTPDMKMEGGNGPRKEDDGSGFYLSLRQFRSGSATLLLRGSAEPAYLASAIRRAVAEIDPNLALGRVLTLKAAREEDLLGIRLVSVVFTVFGISAAFLGGMGVYGIMSFSVNRRMREFGIRLALGAQRNDIISMLARQGSVQIAIGMVCGLLLSYYLVRILISVIPELRAAPLGLYLRVLAFLSCVAFLALWIPARRASRVDATVALRHD